MLTCVVTQQGRDHLVKIILENRSVMIANMHLEPGSTIRNLLERLHGISERAGLPTLLAWALLLEISTFVSLRKDDPT